THLQAIIVGLLAFGYFCELVHQVFAKWYHSEMKRWADFLHFISKLETLDLVGLAGMTAIILGYVLMCLNKSGLI
ncbi:MAG: hypothetical protein ABJP94_23390, partial [Paracoccaceae bacterium]